MARRILILVSLVGVVIAISFAVGFYARQPPVRTVGPSMAMTLLGKHGEVVCEKCGYTFAFDAEETPLPQRPLCPNCGHVHGDDTPVRLIAGDLVQLDRRAPRQRPLQRYDLVAFDVPNEPDKLGVKRVIGLPGERIGIHAGEILVNDEVLRKETPTSRDLWTLVHDGRFAPQDRWVADDPQDIAWAQVPADDATAYFAQRDIHADANDFAWLTYQHFPLLDLRPPPTNTIPINDFDGYNASLARSLNDVGDARVEFRLKATPGTVVAVKMHDGWSPWQVELKCSGPPNVSVTAPGRIPNSDTLVVDFQKGCAITISLRDGELRVEIDGEEIMRVNCPPGDTPRRVLPNQLTLGIQRGEATFSELRVYRDIYYLNPDGRPQTWAMDRVLAADEYFLLGDNPPVSVDSRHFGPLKRGVIRGVVEK